MEKLKEILESNHKELLSLLNPLVDFMIKNEYTYFLVAGKEGVCTRHLRGNGEDVNGMIVGMMETNSQVATILEDSVRCFKQASKKKTLNLKKVNSSI